MDIKDVFISEYEMNKTAILYPQIETKGSIKRTPIDLIDSDKDFNHGIVKYHGYRIHHIETLQPVIYYIRFLIDKEGTDKRYVVTARVNLNNFGHNDFLELVKKVIDKIRKM